MCTILAMAPPFASYGISPRRSRRTRRVRKFILLNFVIFVLYSLKFSRHAQIFRRIIPNFLNQKYCLTTKHTKATKVSDIDIFKLLNFVIFVSSFENTRLGMRTKRPAWVPSYPRKRVSRLIRRNKPGFPRARE